jgi:hypothetical protein
VALAVVIAEAEALEAAVVIALDVLADLSDIYISF